MSDPILYLHGQGGNAAEAKRFRPLFPDSEVRGLEYRGTTPWETGAEIREAVERMGAGGKSLTLIANSIGAFYAMCAGIEERIRRAYFISPIVAMEKLIADRLAWAGVTEEELKTRGSIPVPFGEDLSWEYLCYVREHPLRWRVPTEILYGSRDGLTSYETMADFAAEYGAGLAVMENGEHFFHTEEQLRFLDEWLRCAGCVPGARVNVCGSTCCILRLLGRGKGGYSFLAERGGKEVVLKQIHHEPCAFYRFGNKIEAERRDYERLRQAGIRIPAMLALDADRERIVKEYIEGAVVLELVRENRPMEAYLAQVREMAAKAREAGLNIDYFPTNFVARDGLLWYVDYECNEYSDAWSFENWGVRWWSRTSELEAYLRQNE